MLQSRGEVVTEVEGDSWMCREAKRECAGNEPSLGLLADLLPFCSSAKDPNWSPHAPPLPSPQRSSGWSATTCCKASGAIFAALVWMSRCWRMRMTTGKLLRLVTPVCVYSFICAPWGSSAALCVTAVVSHSQPRGSSLAGAAQRALPPVPLLRDCSVGRSGKLCHMAARSGWSLQWCVGLVLHFQRGE